MACRRQASLKQNTWHSVAIDKAFILSSNHSIFSIFNCNFTSNCNKASFKNRFSFPGNFQVTTDTVLPVELLLWPPAGAGHRAGHRLASTVPSGALREELCCQSKGSNIQELPHQIPTMAQQAQKERHFCRVLRGPRWISNHVNVTLMPHPKGSRPWPSALSGNWPEFLSGASLLAFPAERIRVDLLTQWAESCVLIKAHLNSFVLSKYSCKGKVQPHSLVGELLSINFCWWINTNKVLGRKKSCWSKR